MDVIVTCQLGAPRGLRRAWTGNRRKPAKDQEKRETGPDAGNLANPMIGFRAQQT
jgi:hypothetical protein